ncbi:MAG: phage gp6-like head-tail connector protein, partial [Clostridia bacterium]|nr:phage gp6-like head-tail connector protein [Clostridia bacterium]
MILDKVKAVCRVTSTAYNEELTDLIAAAFADLGIPDIKPEVLTDTPDPLILRAVLTYCKMNFGYCPEDQYAR